MAVECFQEGLYWRGLTHDLSKFLPSEFFPYAKYFYGKEKTEKIERDFDFAWLLHQKRNPHHWQYWILREDDGKTKIFEMKKRYLMEMLFDWVGAGRALGAKYDETDRFKETRIWYYNNMDKMKLHKNTRRQVNILLDERVKFAYISHFWESGLRFKGQSIERFPDADK